MCPVFLSEKEAKAISLSLRRQAEIKLQSRTASRTAKSHPTTTTALHPPTTFYTAT